MTEQQDQTPGLTIPRNDDEVFSLLDPFPVAVAKAIGATVQMDQVITVQEYQALARAAENLENLTPLPSVMSALVLQAVLEDASLDSALRHLKTLAQDRPEAERAAVFQAVQPIIQLKGKRGQSLAREWASALRLQDSTFRLATDDIQTALNRILSGFRSLRSSKESLIQKAERFARTYHDPQLAAMANKVLSGGDSVSDAALRGELSAAVERVFRNTSSVLKTQEILDEQIELTRRFLRTSEALADQIRLRLQSVKDRLDLQNQMFEEDVEDLVKKVADSVEISMRDLMEGRTDWADKTIWEQLGNRGSFSEILAAFQPLKRRYEQIFDLWRKEVDLFAQEAGAIRAGVFMNIDPRAFHGLLPTSHITVSLRNTLDRAANTTITTLGIAGIGTVALTLTGHLAALSVVVSGPVALAVGIVVAPAIVWKVFSKPEARKRGLVQTKRQVVEKKLIELLEGEALNHKSAAQDIMNRFVRAAFDHYAPLVIDARMAALRATLEPQVVHRVLSDTRKVLLPSG